MSVDNGEPCFIISIAARLVNMHPQTLRYYERIGLIIPSRTRGKIRLYSQRDVERLLMIQRLVNDLGVNLAGVEVIINLTERLAEAERRLHELEERAEAAERKCAEVATRAKAKA
ncbi:MAG: helix-turn-helix transcriptional regulator [Dehalococcoidales bacterium]|nr:helix-turn-helix transcriptional regulator [Dehalococcoidales bacterium]